MGAPWVVLALWLIHGKQRIGVKGYHWCVSDISPQALATLQPSRIKAGKPGIQYTPALWRMEWGIPSLQLIWVT